MRHTDILARASADEASSFKYISVSLPLADEEHTPHQVAHSIREEQSAHVALHTTSSIWVNLLISAFTKIAIGYIVYWVNKLSRFEFEVWTIGEDQNQKPKIVPEYLKIVTKLR